GNRAPLCDAGRPNQTGASAVHRAVGDLEISRRVRGAGALKFRCGIPLIPSRSLARLPPPPLGLRLPFRSTPAHGGRTADRLRIGSGARTNRTIRRGLPYSAGVFSGVVSARLWQFSAALAMAAPGGDAYPRNGRPRRRRRKSPDDFDLI